MSKFLDRTFETGGDRSIYFNDEGRGVSIGAIHEGLYTVTEIIHACRNMVEDLLDIQCGNGIYNGQFMLMKLGMDHALSITAELGPISDIEGHDFHYDHHADGSKTVSVKGLDGPKGGAV